MILSVIVVTYNIRELSRQCLRTVQSARFAGEVEIIVVDNASHDGTPDALEADFPGIKVIRNDENLGFAAALNIGTAAAHGELILSLNPDTIIEVLKKYQEAGVDQVLCFLQMGNLAHTRIMDSIKLMGRHVIPYFK